MLMINILPSKPLKHLYNFKAFIISHFYRCAVKFTLLKVHFSFMKMTWRNVPKTYLLAKNKDFLRWKWNYLYNQEMAAEDQ